MGDWGDLLIDSFKLDAFLLVELEADLWLVCQRSTDGLHDVLRRLISPEGEVVDGDHGPVVGTVLLPESLVLSQDEVVVQVLLRLGVLEGGSDAFLGSIIVVIDLFVAEQRTLARDKVVALFVHELDIVPPVLLSVFSL